MFSAASSQIDYYLANQECLFGIACFHIGHIALLSQTLLKLRYYVSFMIFPFVLLFVCNQDIAMDKHTPILSSTPIEKEEAIIIIDPFHFSFPFFFGAAILQRSSINDPSLQARGESFCSGLET